MEERALVAIKAHPDGAFDMLPGFSKPGYKYRFEDSHGALFVSAGTHLFTNES
jgi:Meckel syndrome type 1 protein